MLFTHHCQILIKKKKTFVYEAKCFITFLYKLLHSFSFPHGWCNQPSSKRLSNWSVSEIVLKFTFHDSRKKHIVNGTNLRTIILTLDVCINKKNTILSTVGSWRLAMLIQKLIGSIMIITIHKWKSFFIDPNIYLRSFK